MKDREVVAAVASIKCLAHNSEVLRAAVTVKNSFYLLLQLVLEGLFDVAIGDGQAFQAPIHI